MVGGTAKWSGKDFVNCGNISPQFEDCLVINEIIYFYLYLSNKFFKITLAMYNLGPMNGFLNINKYRFLLLKKKLMPMDRCFKVLICTNFILAL